MTFDSWQVPLVVVAETESALRSGAHEVFCIWTGERTQAGPQCAIDSLIVPEQTPESSEFGVAVRIEGRELSRIQFENFRSGRRSFVQLHTHPTSNVRMSGLDRQREVVKHVGALSIIVPSYGNWGLDGLRGVAIYERASDDWRLWTHDEAVRRLIFRP